MKSNHGVRIIAPVARRAAAAGAHRCSLAAVAVLSRRSPSAHDFERTQVTLVFARDGSFVLDVANDAAWLEHRLIPIPTRPFADRVVLFVDGREVRPTSVERVAGAPPLTIVRMRGRVPARRAHAALVLRPADRPVSAYRPPRRRPHRRRRDCAAMRGAGRSICRASSRRRGQRPNDGCRDRCAPADPDRDSTHVETHL